MGTTWLFSVDGAPILSEMQLNSWQKSLMCLLSLRLMGKVRRADMISVKSLVFILISKRSPGSVREDMPHSFGVGKPLAVRSGSCQLCFVDFNTFPIAH